MTKMPRNIWAWMGLQDNGSWDETYGLYPNSEPYNNTAMTIKAIEGMKRGNLKPTENKGHRTYYVPDQQHNQALQDVIKMLENL